jgi:hypothetical protein
MDVLWKLLFYLSNWQQQFIAEEPILTPKARDTQERTVQY